MRLKIGDPFEMKPTVFGPSAILNVKKPLKKKKKKRGIYAPNQTHNLSDFLQ